MRGEEHLEVKACIELFDKAKMAYRPMLGPRILPRYACISSVRFMMALGSIRELEIKQTSCLSIIMNCRMDVINSIAALEKNFGRAFSSLFPRSRAPQRFSMLAVSVGRGEAYLECLAGLINKF